jgi:hypothetical protein
MPVYVFEHPTSKEKREILLPIDKRHSYIDENNIEWVRVFTTPNISTDTQIDPYSQQAFLEKTKKAGTIGDLFDLSKDLSEKRGGDKNDPIKKDFVGNWKNTRQFDGKLPENF